MKSTFISTTTVAGLTRSPGRQAFRVPFSLRGRAGASRTQTRGLPPTSERIYLPHCLCFFFSPLLLLQEVEHLPQCLCFCFAPLLLLLQEGREHLPTSYVCVCFFAPAIAVTGSEHLPQMRVCVFLRRCCCCCCCYRKWPMSVHEMTAAMYYLLAQRRGERGAEPNGEHEAHAGYPAVSEEELDFLRRCARMSRSDGIFGV